MRLVWSALDDVDRCFSHQQHKHFPPRGARVGAQHVWGSISTEEQRWRRTQGRRTARARAEECCSDARDVCSVSPARKVSASRFKISMVSSQRVGCAGFGCGAHWMGTGMIVVERTSRLEKSSRQNWCRRWRTCWTVTLLRTRTSLSGTALECSSTEQQEWAGESGGTCDVWGTGYSVWSQDRYLWAPWHHLLCQAFQQHFFLLGSTRSTYLSRCVITIRKIVFFFFLVTMNFHWLDVFYVLRISENYCSHLRISSEFSRQSQMTNQIFLWLDILSFHIMIFQNWNVFLRKDFLDFVMMEGIFLLDNTIDHVIFQWIHILFKNMTVMKCVLFLTNRKPIILVEISETW